MNYFRSLCYFGCKINLCELPVIKPTEYMFEKYANLGVEKWEIFAEVTRKIMCEIGGLTPSDKTFRDSKRYENFAKFLNELSDKDYLKELQLIHSHNYLKRLEYYTKIIL